MRDKTNYAKGSSFSNQWKYVNFAAMQLVGQTMESDYQEEKLPYLFTDSNGKYIMFEKMIEETNIALADIPLTEENVYEMISDSVKLEDHPYLPDETTFDLGIWGFPCVGTRQSAKALRENGKVHDFIDLVKSTRAALSQQDRESDDISGGRTCTMTEAISEALVGYYMTWYYLNYTEIWVKAYQETYLNPGYMKECKSAGWEKNFLIEKEKKNYWERTLMLVNEVINEEEYKDYITSLPMDIETVTQSIKKIWLKEGALAIEDYGRLVLWGTYLDFWRWIYEEKEYQKDEVLTQIACYAEDDEVRINKQRLFDVLKKYDEYAVEGLVLSLSFHSEKTQISYSLRRRDVACKVEIRRTACLKKLIEYSHSFKKFSLNTQSAAIFCQSTQEECQLYLRQIENGDLCRAFVLYYPSERDKVMESISPRLRIMLLEDMETFANADYFTLSECVESEHKITCILKKMNEEVGNM